MRSSRRSKGELGVCLASLLLTSAAQAGVAPDLAHQLQQDHETLTHYEWTATFDVAREGESLGSMVETMGFDSDGLPTRTVVKDGRTAAAKKKHAWKQVDDLTGLALPYVLPTLDMYGQFLAGAVASKGERVIELRALGYIDPEDSVTLQVDPKSLRALMLTVSAPYQGDRAQIEAIYKPIPDGPNHPSQITVIFGEWRIVITNSDYRKSH